MAIINKKTMCNERYSLEEEAIHLHSEVSNTLSHQRQPFLSFFATAGCSTAKLVLTVGK